MENAFQLEKTDFNRATICDAFGKVAEESKTGLCNLDSDEIRLDVRECYSYESVSDGTALSKLKL